MFDPQPTSRKTHKQGPPITKGHQCVFDPQNATHNPHQQSPPIATASPTTLQALLFILQVSYNKEPRMTEFISMVDNTMAQVDSILQHGAPGTLPDAEPCLACVDVHPMPGHAFAACFLCLLLRLPR